MFVVVTDSHPPMAARVNADVCHFTECQTKRRVISEDDVGLKGGQQALGRCLAIPEQAISVRDSSGRPENS